MGIGSKDHCLDDHSQRSHDRHTPHPSMSPAEQILLTIAFVWNSVLIIHTNDVQHGKERTQTHHGESVQIICSTHTPTHPDSPGQLIRAHAPRLLFVCQVLGGGCPGR